MNEKNGLSDYEQKVYDYLKGRGEIITAKIPNEFRGTISSLKHKGLIEVYKKRTSTLWSEKKHKFLRIKQLKRKIQN
jgi:hypothetical protein